MDHAPRARLITNSDYTSAEIERNTPVPPERVTVIHHGVPDPFGATAVATGRSAWH